MHMKFLKNSLTFQNLSFMVIFFALVALISSCGYKDDPSPLFQNHQNNFEKEVQKRKNSLPEKTMKNKTHLSHL